MDSGSGVVVTILAIWGAALSTFNTVRGFLKDRKDRGDIRVTGDLESYFQNEYGEQVLAKLGEPVPQKVILCLRLTATNAGRRPVSILEWGAEKRDGSEWRKENRPSAQDPMSEGGRCEFVDLHTLSSLLEDSVAAVFVRDSLQRKWYLPRARVSTLPEDAKELQRQFAAAAQGRT